MMVLSPKCMHAIFDGYERQDSQKDMFIALHVHNGDRSTSNEIMEHMNPIDHLCRIPYVIGITNTMFSHLVPMNMS